MIDLIEHIELSEKLHNLFPGGYDAYWKPDMDGLWRKAKPRRVTGWHVSVASNGISETKRITDHGDLGRTMLELAQKIVERQKA